MKTTPALPTTVQCTEAQIETFINRLGEGDVEVGKLPLEVGKLPLEVRKLHNTVRLVAQVTLSAP